MEAVNIVCMVAICWNGQLTPKNFTPPTLQLPNLLDVRQQGALCTKNSRALPRVVFKKSNPLG